MPQSQVVRWTQVFQTEVSFLANLALHPTATFAASPVEPSPVEPSPVEPSPVEPSPVADCEVEQWPPVVDRALTVDRSTLSRNTGGWPMYLNSMGCPTVDRSENESWASLHPVAIKTSSGLDSSISMSVWAALTRVGNYEMDTITERLAMQHITGPLGVTFCPFDELIPKTFQSKFLLIDTGGGGEASPLKTKSLKTKSLKIKSVKTKRPKTTHFRVSPSSPTGVVIPPLDLAK
jgi:hypothetical protein